MSSKRIDRLLAETLDGGRIPDDATLEERNEVLRLVAAAQAIQATRATVTLEADRTFATSRARFERHLAGARPSAGARRPRFSGRFGALAACGSLATAVVAVLAVLFGLGLFTSDVDTANAIEVGDFVQFEGTIPEGGVSADGKTLDVETSFGRFSVEILHDTSVVDGTDLLEPGSLRPGDTIVIAGLVGERNRLQAASLSRSDGTPVPPPGLRIRALGDFLPGIEGVVVAVALPKDGLQARVVIETTAHERFLLVVSASTVAELVEAGAGGLGAVVRVVDDAGADPGVLGLDVSATSERPLRGVNIAGVVLSADGPVLELSTLRGSRTVVLRESTRIVLPEGSLSPAERDRPGALVGHRVAVQGQSAADGRFHADVLIVGAEHRPGDRLDGPLRGP
ncbi:MAG: hypothetical protein WEC33_03895 [Dehalococcoidia bacterium]